MDLGDFQSTSADNGGNKYMLFGIDILSRMHYAVPVKSKSSAHMIAALDELFKQTGYLPSSVSSDRGLEFTAKPIKDYFKTRDINQFYAFSDDCKAACAERGLRNVKARLYKFFAEKKTVNWTRVLPDVLRAINQSVCRTTGVTPISVTKDNWIPLWERLYRKYFVNERPKPRYKVGDRVRIDKAKGQFSKGYLPGFTGQFMATPTLVTTHFRRNFYDQRSETYHPNLIQAGGQRSREYYWDFL